MKKIKKDNKQNLLVKFIFLGIIPIILLLFWILGSLLLNTKVGSTILVYSQKDSEIKYLSEGILFKGNIISGEFKARDNYLNFLQFKFDEYAKHDFVGEEVLAFRIRAKGEESWSYTSTYKTSLLENNLLFPFEFPTIKNSRDIMYQFEIESLLGNNTNGVEVRKSTAEVYSGYKYPLSDIIKNNATTREFFFKKVFTSFTNIDFFLRSLIYLIPLLVYIIIYTFFLYPRKKFYDKRYTIAVFVITLFYIDVFQIKQAYLGLLLILILGWIILVLANKLGSKSSFIFAFSLIFLWILLPLFKVNDYQNKINLWTYTFLTIGLVHAVLEEKKQQLFKVK